jgi:hypothetical protein
MENRWLFPSSNISNIGFPPSRPSDAKNIRLSSSLVSLEKMQEERVKFFAVKKMTNIVGLFGGYIESPSTVLMIENAATVEEEKV